MTSGIICLPRHLRGDALTAWMLRKPSSAPTFRIRTKIILVGRIHAFQRAEGNTSSVHSVSLHSHSSLFVHSLSLSLSVSSCSSSSIPYTISSFVPSPPPPEFQPKIFVLCWTEPIRIPGENRASNPIPAALVCLLFT